MEHSEEKLLKDYPNPIFIESTTKILNQMKKSIGRICCTDGSKGTGFFCKIFLPKENRYIPVFISNYHVIQEGSEIEIHIYDEKFIKKINLDGKFKYSNPIQDVSIIEVKEMEEDPSIEFMELDDNVIDGNNIDFIGSSVYILQYPGILEGKKAAVSYGIIKQKFSDKSYNFMHFCSTEYGSSGSPILGLSNNKIIGIHKERGNKEYNVGGFLSDSIKEFINKYLKINIVKKIDTNKLGINDKNLFNNIYNKGLVKDFIQIKDKDINIAYEFPLYQKNVKRNYEKWEIGWHGTLYQNLDSIIKYGLNPPGIELEEGIFSPKTKYNHPEKVYGMKNWEDAIFASDKLYLAMYYSENQFRCVLEVKIEPDKYSTFYSSMGQLVCIEINYFSDEGIYRIPLAENVIINSVLFVNHNYIEKVLSEIDPYTRKKRYTEVEDLILNFKNLSNK